MARPTVIQNQSILDAARLVFLERGNLGTSLEIARRAGVCEGTIFKRFGSKAGLFRAAMNVEDEPPALRELPERAGLDSVENNLTAAALEVIAHVQSLLPMWKMHWARSKRSGSL